MARDPKASTPKLTEAQRRAPCPACNGQGVSSASMVWTDEVGWRCRLCFYREDACAPRRPRSIGSVKLERD